MIRFPLMVLAVLSVVMLSSSTPVTCQNDSSSETLMVDGSVVSVDNSNSKIVVKAVETLSFTVPSDAKITNDDGFDIKLSDINTGDYVLIEYYDGKDGSHIARNINVEYSS